MVTGLTRSPQGAEQWVMNVCRNNVQPAIIPYWETVQIDERTIGVLTVPDSAPDKPYKAKRGSAWVTFVRVGSTCREATREEEQRLYQAAGVLRYDIKPVPGSTLEDLDQERLVQYFRLVRRQPESSHELREWERQLANIEVLVEEGARYSVTVGGLLLFGLNPNRFLPQAGITATAYPGQQKDYAVHDAEVIRGPIVPILTEDLAAANAGGVIDRAIEFVRRNMGSSVASDGGRRGRRPAYPPDTVREVVVNAIAHRDYSISVTDIELSLYQDRLEVISPGRLPNTVTVDKMRQGYRAARNELLKEVLRDYNYIEHRGMGIPYKVIAGMRAHNGTEPDLIADEDRFIVRLWKQGTGQNDSPPSESATDPSEGSDRDG